ncbi:DegT/DnrJ/EryC1/StrS family aminotransferase [Roseofilum sp. BLCC_M154]|uniref:DegT/DnrJ/EryC1/StrS family aminotransferase n=1 Tax=Roseofilum acuticapitatum BLCC-M154 TaxID=3022444 RepID=A0ABT7AWM5_9CYAN|nr:DegT/DnrJ/EryC1/StrS family aminotransferase [Roseofilum acuticapitatum]MDJ1170453.1 DegT/DnrJ/EryC1/StrS family aminotransferase [Roseofilum acuticapitatum BLCC-M154]
MNNIPPVDLTQQYQAIAPEVEAAVLELLASGRYIGGPVVESFEEQFAEAVGVHHCVACNSGTDALYLALRAVGVGPGDEVITTPFTFIATAETIAMAGATPVFVDVEEESFNLDLSQVEAAITEKTKAIIPVHLFGRPVDMTRLMAIAQSHNLKVIEDCAQAAGAAWAGSPVGSWGDVGCFSFYPTKNLAACGDGGALTTGDGEIGDRVRLLRDHGRRRGYLYEATGVNSRLDALQAAILSIKLKYLAQWNQQRREVAYRYHQLLASVPGIVLPQEIEGGESVWNQYTIRIKGQQKPDPEYRDRVQVRLREQGVISSVYYPLPLHLQPVYEHLGYQPQQLPITEQLSQEVLSLPMFPELTPQQQERVVDCLKNAL